MELNAPFNPISSKRARDLMGVTQITDNIENIINTNIIPDLADAKKRLDNPGMQYITYYGAKHWNYGDAIFDSAPAIQSALDACKGSRDGRLFANIPRGSYRVESPILSDRGTVVKGVDPEQSRIISRANDLTLWHHNTETVTSARVAAPWHMEGLSFHVDQYGPFRALDIRQDGMYGGFYMKHVHFRSFNDAFNWKHSFMRLRGVVSGVMDGIVGTGSAYNKAGELAQATPYGIVIESVNNQLPFYGLTITNTRLGARDHCILMQILGNPGDSGTIEGIIVRDSFFRSCLGAAIRQWVPNSAGWWMAPLYVFDSINTEGPGASLQMDSCSDVWINKCWFVQAEKYNDTRPNVVEFLYGHDIRITDSTFMAFAGSKSNSLLAIASNMPQRGESTGCIRVKLDGLHFRADDANNSVTPPRPKADLIAGSAVGDIPGLRYTTPSYQGILNFSGGPLPWAGTGPNIA